MSGVGGRRAVDGAVGLGQKGRRFAAYGVEGGAVAGRQIELHLGAESRSADAEPGVSRCGRGRVG